MNLERVALPDLSAITHQVLLPQRGPFEVPAFKVIAYKGEYGHGSAGSKDATYILASAAGAHAAWYSKSIVLDFTELSYEWGDEMELVLSIGHDRVTRCPYPIAIVVGPMCKAALTSLLAERYNEYCVESLAQALDLLKRKREAFEECSKQWRIAAQQRRESERNAANSQ